MNKKGFTLVELLATIIVLAIVVGITIPIVLSSLGSAKEKERRMLVENLKTAVRNYNMECRGGMSSSSLDCGSSSAAKRIYLSQLVEYGFMNNSDKCNNNGKKNNVNGGRDTDSDDEYCIYDPVQKKNIANCEIYVYDNGTYGFCGSPGKCNEDDPQDQPSCLFITQYD